MRFVFGDSITLNSAGVKGFGELRGKRHSRSESNFEQDYCGTEAFSGQSCVSNCCCKLFREACVLFREETGTLNSALQAAQIATVGVMPSHLVTLRMRLGMRSIVRVRGIAC